MKIELKKDDPSLEDITIELKPSEFHSLSDWSYPETITVRQLLDFYEHWIRIAGSVRTFASFKKYAESLAVDLKELASFCDKVPEDY